MFVKPLSVSVCLFNPFPSCILWHTFSVRSGQRWEHYSDVFWDHSEDILKRCDILHKGPAVRTVLSYCEGPSYSSACSVCSFHALHVFVWVFSGYAGYALVTDRIAPQRPVMARRLVLGAVPSFILTQTCPQLGMGSIYHQKVTISQWPPWLLWWSYVIMLSFYLLYAS